MIELENINVGSFWMVELENVDGLWEVKARGGRIGYSNDFLAFPYHRIDFYSILTNAENRLRSLVTCNVEEQGYRIAHCDRKERRLFTNTFLVRYSSQRVVPLNYEPSTEEIEEERVRIAFYSFTLFTMEEQIRRARERLINRHNVLNRSGNVSTTIHTSPEPILSEEEKKRNSKVMQQQSYHRKMVKRPSLQELLT